MRLEFLSDRLSQSSDELKKEILRKESKLASVRLMKRVALVFLIAVGIGLSAVECSTTGHSTNVIGGVGLFMIIGGALGLWWPEMGERILVWLIGAALAGLLYAVF